MRLKNVLVIGSGGREHAIVRQLALGSGLERIAAVPGSAGMQARPQGAGKTAIEVHADIEVRPPFQALIGFALTGAGGEKFDLVVIGPEQPLADGLADRLREKGLRVFGPSAEGARLEASKIHAKELMQAAGVRTARSFVVTSVAECMRAAAVFAPPYVLKADGLAAGKGVFIEKNLAGLETAAKALFDERTLGAAGSRALLEEFSSGPELSHLVLTNGREFVSMPAARDHKRLRDGDKGPNTGGMGVVAPVPLPSGLLATIEKDVVAPVIAEIARRKLDFRGVLYFGLMLTPDGPSILEFNARFGDPEAQVLLPLLDEDKSGSWSEVLAAIADGQAMPKVQWRSDRYAACIVLAAEGYPDSTVKGVPIAGLVNAGDAAGSVDVSKVRKGPVYDAVASGSAYVLHAGTTAVTRGDGSEFVTSGGRVLGATAVSSRAMVHALELAYGVAKSVNWPGRQMRKDIGASLN